MKKTLVSIIAIILAIGCVFATTACSKSKTNTSSDKKVKVFKESAFALTEESYAYLVKKGNSEMVDTINELLTEISENGQFDAILNSFFNGTATFTYTNPASKDGCLVVATNAYFPPFEYYEGDKLTGIDIQVASLLAEKMGKTLYVDDIEFDAVFTSVQAGLADVGMAGITVNPTRQLTFDFSKEYYTSSQVLIVKENDTTFADCKTAADIEEVLKKQNKTFKIGAQKGTTGSMYAAGNEDFEYDGFPNLTVNDYTTGALAIMDLSNGKVNAVILDLQPALSISDSINKTK
jgi:polar amino acid transport system substrate-binding protein